MLSGDGARQLIRASIAILASTPDAALATRRASLQEVERELTGKIIRLVRLAEDGEVEEIGARLRELRRDRDHARADLAARARRPALVRVRRRGRLRAEPTGRVRGQARAGDAEGPVSDARQYRASSRWIREDQLRLA